MKGIYMERKKNHRSLPRIIIGVEIAFYKRGHNKAMIRMIIIIIVNEDMNI